MSSVFFWEPTGINGLLCFCPRPFFDDRGAFFTLWSEEILQQAGVRTPFVQDNCSLSRKGVLRGLHFQEPPQAKLVWAASGAVFDVAVDLRPGSPTFGRHFSAVLDGASHRTLYLPEGFAHGFLALEENTVFCYKCSAYYAPDGQRGVCWNDPALDIPWPFAPTLLSEKDAALPTLGQLKQAAKE